MKLETFFATLSPVVFSTLLFGICATAIGIGMYYFLHSIDSPGEHFVNLPDFYTVENTEVGKFYHIVITDKDNLRSVIQQFKVLDKRDGKILICIDETGDMVQGRIYKEGWVKEVNSREWISPATLMAQS